MLKEIKYISKDNSNCEKYVTIYHYNAIDLKFFIVIDSLKYGPAVGACRYINNTPEDVALSEVLKMARTMTEKNIIAGLPYGGGKSFIYYNAISRNDMLYIFSQALNELNGIYYTTNDIGTSIDDMEFLRRYTPFAKGTKSDGIVIPATAYGVYLSMKAAAKEIWGTDELAGKRIAVQGAGSVGLPLIKYLLAEDCIVFVHDVDETKLDMLRQQYNVSIIKDDFTSCDVDILSPCAIGGVINDTNVMKIKAKLIVGGANNQLASAEMDEILYLRGIMFIPDMLANYGGMIDLFCEGPNYCESYVLKQIFGIGNKVAHFIGESRKSNRSILICLREWLNKKTNR